MSTIDQQFVEFIIRSLVSKPEAVSVERRIDEKGVLLELTVDPEDLGRVIGKEALPLRASAPYCVRLAPKMMLVIILKLLITILP